MMSVSVERLAELGKAEEELERIKTVCAEFREALVHAQQDCHQHFGGVGGWQKCTKHERCMAVQKLLAGGADKDFVSPEKLREVASNIENLPLELSSKQVAWLLCEIADGHEPDLFEGG